MGNRKSSRPGFSLIELLVAVGIIAVLATLIGVAVTRVRKGADKFKLAAQLQTIGVALDAYKSDFQSYPVTSVDDSLRLAAASATTADDVANAAGLRGARLLCKALLGMTGGQSGTIGAVGSTYDLNRPNQDGKPGPGFIVVGRSGVATIKDAAGEMNGKVSGPYLAESALRFSKTTPAGALDPDKAYDDTTVLIDGNDKPILYYPCLNPQATINLPGPGSLAGMFVAGADPTGPGDLANTAVPMYRGTDNSTWLPIATFRKKLGDTSADGVIVAPEQAVTRGNYILWTAGPDGIFGENPNVAANSPDRVDDVTNFQND
jgi:prepilin-type N-terminal cleavage/methylation domain-containing protein